MSDSHQVWENENEWRIYQISYNKKYNASLPRFARLERPKNNKSAMCIGLNDICELSVGRLCTDSEFLKIEKLLHKYQFKNVTVKKQNKNP